MTAPSPGTPRRPVPATAPVGRPVSGVAIAGRRTSDGRAA